MSQTRAAALIQQALAQNATHLNLSKLELTALPPEIGQLTELRVLWLSKLGYWLWSCPYHRRLDVKNPPTAVGGILGLSVRPAVGGIPGLLPSVRFPG